MSIVNGEVRAEGSVNGNVNNSGTLIQQYTLPVASADTLGGIKVGANLSIEADGTLNATASSSGGGTTNYVDLINKPKINNVELTGNKTLAQLGIQASGDYASASDIPTKTSQLTNDSGFLTGVPSEYITETELNAKGYLTEHQDISNLATKDELHSHSNKTVLDNISQTTINNWNAKSDFSGSYNDLTNKPTIPTKVSQLTNDSSYASESYVTNAIANAQLGGGDTEIDLSGYATKDELSNKVDKVTGKSLIADSEITRLAGLSNYDDTEIKNALKSKADTSAIPTKVSQLSNDKGYLTEVPSDYITETELNAKGFLTSVPSEYITETELSNKGYLTTIPTSYKTKTENDKLYQAIGDYATTSDIPTKISQLANDSNYLTTIPSEYVTETELSAKGYLTSVPSTYKTKTENDALYQAKGNYLTSYTETDPVFSASASAKITNTDISNWNAKSDFSGSYNDLTNKPTIPSAYTLPTASASVLGGIKVGANLSIDANGILSATASSGSGITEISGEVDISTLNEGIYINNSDVETYLVYSGNIDETILRKGTIIIVTKVGTTTMCKIIGYELMYQLVCKNTTMNRIEYATVLSVENAVSNVDASSVDGFSLWSGTQVAYEGLTTKDANTVYMILEEV